MCIGLKYSYNLAKCHIFFHICSRIILLILCYTEKSVSNYYVASADKQSRFSEKLGNLLRWNTPNYFTSTTIIAFPSIKVSPNIDEDKRTPPVPRTFINKLNYKQKTWSKQINFFAVERWTDLPSKNTRNSHHIWDWQVLGFLSNKRIK